MNKINLYVFSRRPEISTGKSRLKKKVGKAIGSNFIIYNLKKILKIFYKDNRFDLKICVHPDNATKYWSKNIFPDIKRIPQGKGDLGKKIWNIIKSDNSSKIIIGSDILNVKSSYIISAWKKLKNKDLVFGPSEDGGFWLVGTSNIKKLNFLFHNVDWTVNNTLEQIKTNLPKKTSIDFIKTLKDLD